jgi:hypothetical protein
MTSMFIFSMTNTNFGIISKELNSRGVNHTLVSLVTNSVFYDSIKAYKQLNYLPSLSYQAQRRYGRMLRRHEMSYR